MSNQQDSSSKNLVTIITTLIGVLGTVAVAYFAFRGNIEPKQLEIRATQTAESIRATQSAAAPIQASSTSSLTDNPVPPTTEPSPTLASINWIVDPAGVCRDDKGNYPRWSEYNWALQQCEAHCQSNPTCQGFAMSKLGNYCQILGSDEHNDGTGLGIQITHGDSSQPNYTCYIKP